uniref:Uncharacterized protein n=1 Tax=Caenorhabditis japonica TaxID=281687 RepID=A0A8R1HL52_CAEJA
MSVHHSKHRNRSESEAVSKGGGPDLLLKANEETASDGSGSNSLLKSVEENKSGSVQAKSRSHRILKIKLKKSENEIEFEEPLMSSQEQENGRQRTWTKLSSEEDEGLSYYETQRAKMIETYRKKYLASDKAADLRAMGITE